MVENSILISFLTETMPCRFGNVIPFSVLLAVQPLRKWNEASVLTCQNCNYKCQWDRTLNTDPGVESLYCKHCAITLYLWSYIKKVLLFGYQLSGRFTVVPLLVCLFVIFLGDHEISFLLIFLLKEMSKTLYFIIFQKFCYLIFLEIVWNELFDNFWFSIANFKLFVSLIILQVRKNYHVHSKWKRTNLIAFILSCYD